MDTTKNHIKMKPLPQCKIVKLITGEELCCTIATDQIKDKTNLVRLNNPLLIKYVPHINEIGISDYIAMVKWIGFTNDPIISIPKDKILTICNATLQFNKRYDYILRKANQVPQEMPDYIERDMSEKDYNDMKTYDKNRVKKLKKLQQFFDMSHKRTLH
jgi:hypothetical protein|tara:strand:+ start:830 stop:1306 length:477 start_codon:yes stop_codon:yes gene_type:complete